MSNYSDNPNDCRVDFFKESGKWYDTIQVTFEPKDYADTQIHDALRNALEKACPNNYQGLQAICLKPYHKHSHPISLIWKGKQVSYSPEEQTDMRPEGLK